MGEIDALAVVQDLEVVANEVRDGDAVSSGEDGELEEPNFDRFGKARRGLLSHRDRTKEKQSRQGAPKSSSQRIERRHRRILVLGAAILRHFASG